MSFSLLREYCCLRVHCSPKAQGEQRVPSRTQVWRQHPKAEPCGGCRGGLVPAAKMAAALTPSYVLRSQPCPHHHHHHHHLTAGNCSGCRGSAGRGGGGAEPGLRLPVPSPSPQFVTPGCWGQSRPRWAVTGRRAPVPPFFPSPARASHGAA